MLRLHRVLCFAMVPNIQLHAVLDKNPAASFELLDVSRDRILQCDELASIIQGLGLSNDEFLAKFDS